MPNNHRLNVTDAAKVIGCSPRTVSTLIHAGRLKATKVKSDISRLSRYGFIYSIKKEDAIKARNAYGKRKEKRGWKRGRSRKTT